jgi:hypothetical protein
LTLSRSLSLPTIVMAGGRLFIFYSFMAPIFRETASRKLFRLVQRAISTPRRAS